MRKNDKTIKGKSDTALMEILLRTWDGKGNRGVTYGGYSNQIVVNEDFVLRMPEKLPLEKVAPLLCAGITTYSDWQRA